MENEKSKSVEVTVEISTKDRYHTTLPLALTAVANQTYKPARVLIFDDGEQRDLRPDPLYSSLFAMFHSKGIPCEVIFGQRKGQVHNHQAAIEISKTEWIWRVDDDDVPEPNVLETLVSHIADDVGAISGLILVPGEVSYLSHFASNKIEHIFNRPNVQWFKFEGTREVDHLNNSFLFRKSAAKHGYCMELSPVGHREETLFTYGMRRAGFKLIVDPKAVIWHLRSPGGGIRSYESSFLWEHDEKVFHRKLEEYGIQTTHDKLVVLDCGLGDHYAFKMMLPELKEKYKDQPIVLGVCYPDVFEGETGVELISIADSKLIDPDQDKHNIYRFMIEHNWKGRLVDAYRKMLL